MPAMGTESVDPRFDGIETWPTGRAIAAMLTGQRAAIAAVAGASRAIAAAAEAAAARLASGRGRIAYAGAGTSGRIGVQDGVELTPTFGWPERRLAFLLAGGPEALMRAVEGAEDDAAAARAAVQAEALGRSDVLIGLAASGRTPFTIGALTEARARGALTIALANNRGAPLLAAGDHPILLDTGAEVIAGSTRMQAGTAQKAALNLLSTAIMLRLGLVHRGLMVNMRVSNAKLRARAQAMIAELAGVAQARAGEALDLAEGDIRAAMLVALGLPLAQARARLDSGERPFAALLAEVRG